MSFIRFFGIFLESSLVQHRASSRDSTRDWKLVNAGPKGGNFDILPIQSKPRFTCFSEAYPFTESWKMTMATTRRSFFVRNLVSATRLSGPVKRMLGKQFPVKF